MVALLSSLLFGKVYQSNKKHLQSLYNMIAVSFKTKVFKDVLPLALKAYEKDDTDVKIIEGLARINFYLGNGVLYLLGLSKLISTNLCIIKPNSTGVGKFPISFDGEEV